MDRAASPNPATAREIILEIVRNMKEGLEPLHYSTLAPAIYHVYLHPDDMDRLRGIVPRIVEEARRALDEELDNLNRGSLVGRLKLSRKAEPKITAPDGGWQVRILENTDDDTQAGDIVIYSELALPAKPDFGAGSMTKKIATRRMGGTQSSSHSYQESHEKPKSLPLGTVPPASVQMSSATSVAASSAGGVAKGAGHEKPVSAAAKPQVDPGAFAVLEYEDGGDRKTYQMTKEQIVVGRGGRDYWTDLKLDTLPDVSREHFRLRRDPESGKFFLKDLSRLGTTINGQKAPSSIEYVGGEKRDRNVEVPVPETARIGLAEVLYLEFRSIPNG
ncbi:MAG TPA: FHA domain-containing protein [Bryobacteraceae bacterium]|nr:FHA domain-containing protein [Bryobacteraceae bacterium]